MARPIGELDQIHLVPLDGATLADAFANLRTHLDGTPYELSYDPAGLVTVSDGTMAVLEVLEEVTGGCLVRLAPVLGDVAELASFLDDRDAAQAMIDCEEMAGRAIEIVESLGGVEAIRIKGRWRAMDPVQRGLWAAHAVASNTQRMRALSGRADAASSTSPDLQRRLAA